MKKPSVLLIVLLVVVVCASVILTVIVFNNNKNDRADEITDELADEFSRIRWFITDWYNEIEHYGSCRVYLNEIQIDGGHYTLTYAQNRIRAVYPRGERFFKIELITKIEFFEVNGILRCRLSYGKTGEYMFIIN